MAWRRRFFRVWLVVAAIAALLVALTTTARADEGFTGAQYLDDKTEFASGYSYALWIDTLDIMAPPAPGVSEGQFSNRQLRMRACFLGANFNSENLHQAVIRHLQAKPDELLQPAFLAVFETFLELCPPA